MDELLADLRLYDARVLRVQVDHVIDPARPLHATEHDFGSLLEFLEWWEAQGEMTAVYAGSSYLASEGVLSVTVCRNGP
jgi:hypothetical protein